MSWGSKFLKIIFLFWCSSAWADASPPLIRHDLYKKISNSLGVSVKDIYLALDNGDSRAKLKINLFARKEGSEHFKADYEKHIQHIQESCLERNTKSYCDEVSNPSKEELNNLLGLASNFKKNPERADGQNLIWSIVLFSYVVKYRILGVEYSKWSDICPPSSQNNLECKRCLYSIGYIDDIVKELAVEASKKTGSSEALKKIKKRIEVYEKI